MNRGEIKLQLGENGVQCPNCSKPHKSVWLDEDTGDRFRMVCFFCDAMFTTPTEYADRCFSHDERVRYYTEMGLKRHFYSTPLLEEHVFEKVSDMVERLLLTEDGADVDPFSLPPEIAVIMMAPMKTTLMATSVLENALDSMDEEHGDPNGQPTEATETMLAAAETFVAALAKEYTSYWYESTGDTFTLDLTSYLSFTRHNPTESILLEDFVKW